MLELRVSSLRTVKLYFDSKVEGGESQGINRGNYQTSEIFRFPKFLARVAVFIFLLFYESVLAWPDLPQVQAELDLTVQVSLAPQGQV